MAEQIPVSYTHLDVYKRQQGAGVLRFVPVGAVKRVDGGRPTSRGLPPAALGDGRFPKKGFSRD